MRERRGKYREVFQVRPKAAPLQALGTGRRDGPNS
jgi:hypothetical protein